MLQSHQYRRLRRLRRLIDEALAEAQLREVHADADHEELRPRHEIR